MAIINSNGSGGGNWSATASWAGGVVPLAADDVTIAPNDTITLDAVSCSANTVTLARGTVALDVGGILTSSITADSVLTLESSLSALGSATGDYGSHLNLDMSSTSVYSCKILLNNSNNATSQGININQYARETLKGETKTRNTFLVGAVIVGATSCNVIDVTGWRVGDYLAFATTDPYTVVAHVDEVTIDSIIGNTISWIGGLTYAHQTACPVGNFSSNVEIRSAATGYKAFNFLRGDGGKTHVITYVSMWELDGYTGWPYGGMTVQGGASTGVTTIHNNNSYYNSPVIYYNPAKSLQSHHNIFIRDTGRYIFAIGHQNAVTPVSGESDSMIFRAARTGLRPNGRDADYSNFRISGANDAALVVEGDISDSFQNLDIWSCNDGIRGSYSIWGIIQIYNGSLGVSFGATNAYNIYADYPLAITFKDTNTAGNMYRNFNNLTSWGYVKMLNKNNDLTLQETYTVESTTSPMYSRDNTVLYRGGSSLKLLGSGLNSAREVAIEVTAASGQAVRIIGYCLVDAAFYNAGDWYPPTVTISGAGITPVVYTGTLAANGAWEQFDISAVQSTGAPRQLSITFKAESKAGAAIGNAWFDGVPITPYVLQVRHYGYVFDEANPIRVVDNWAGVNESTAIAYTGATIDNTLKQLTFASGTIDTFQKLYDYTQAFCAANIAVDVPYTRAGTTALLKSNWTIIDPVLTDVTWSGATIQLSSLDINQLNLDANILDFTNVGTYQLRGILSGTLTLINTSGGNVTVEVPIGTLLINTGPNITIANPNSDIVLTINSNISLIGAEVRIYDMEVTPPDFGTELDGTESNLTTNYIYVGPASNFIRIQVLLTGYVEFSQTLTTPNSDGSFDITLKVDSNV